MTVKYGFYDSLNGDRLYTADDINTFFEGIFSDGVFEFVGNGLKVENSPGTMNVLVRDGRAWFNNLWIRNTSTLTLTLEPSHMIYDRIDVVVLEFDSGITVRKNSIKIITGTPSDTPVPPVLANTSTLHQYALAHIYVRASVSEIRFEDITNKIGTVSTPYARSIVSTPISTALNDFQLGDNSGGWIKKTKLETVDIIRSITDFIYPKRLVYPFASYIHISPLTGTSYPFSSTLPSFITYPKQFSIAVFIGAINNSSNYWKISLRDGGTSTVIAEVNTMNLATNSGHTLVSTTLALPSVSQSVHKYLYIYVTKEGTPSNLNLHAPTVEYELS